jgi:hypothetical protein
MEHPLPDFHASIGLTATQKEPALVSRFWHSHHVAAAILTNVRSKGTLENMTISVALTLTIL